MSSLVVQPRDLPARVAALEAQHEKLQFNSFTNEDSWHLGTAAVSLAQEASLAITIDIRRGDQQLFHAALPGTTPNNDAWIERKTNTTRRFGKSSLLVRHSFDQTGRVVSADFGLDPMVFAAAGGCVPIVVRDIGLVGTLTISGLTQEEDHDFAVAALEHHLAQPRLKPGRPLN